MVSDRPAATVVVRLSSEQGKTLQLDDVALDRRSSSKPAGSDTLDAVQRAHIETILVQCAWRINGTGNAAERLGIHPNTLHSA